MINLRPIRKAILVPILIVLALTLGYLFIDKAELSTYVPLNTQEVRSYLQTNKIPFQTKENQLLIPKNGVFQVKSELGLVTYRTPEKLLESKLENNIAQFENIENANIIFDSESSASVILTLTPGTHLSSQQVRSIIFHISSSVAGLSPNNVAVSDTTGKLYHSIDPKGSFDQITSDESIAEQNIQTKIDSLLGTLVGANNFFTDVKLTLDEKSYRRTSRVAELIGSKGNKLPIKSIQTTITINQNVADGEENRKHLRHEIEKNLTSLLSRYNADLNSNVAFTIFDSGKPLQKIQTEIFKINQSTPTMGVLLFALALQGGCWLYILVNWQKQKLQNNPQKDFNETLDLIRIRIANDNKTSVAAIKDWLNEQKIHT